MIDDRVNGVYVIVKRDDNLQLENFDGVLGKDVPCQTINIQGFPKEPQLDPDGLVLNLEPKALVYVTYRPDIAKFGFHMANVAPSNLEVKENYNIVLSKLGFTNEIAN